MGAHRGTPGPLPCGTPPRDPAAGGQALAALTRFAAAHPSLLVLTGAGCSTDSGIPDYRDAEGAWKRKPPVQYGEFVASPAVRRRYWARSLIGWRLIDATRPNAAHRALARLEAAGHVECLVTQNVDGLHRAAGSRRVVDLHGRLDAVLCLACGEREPRRRFQGRLAALNPGYAALGASHAPDGDADLERADFADFRVPDCPACGGVLKPDVVFFGENVPRARVERALAALEAADGLLVVGSSLMVYSGYRFVRAARAAGKPVAAVNLGRTRADAELDLKLGVACGPLLAALADSLPLRP